MAYLAIKKVNGHHYAYVQESYREGGQVRTRTVEYLGAVAPRVAAQVQATRQQLGQADQAALVASVRSAVAAIADAKDKAASETDRESRATTTEPLAALPELQADTAVPSRPLVSTPSSPNLITTQTSPKAATPKASFLSWPDDLERFNVSRTGLDKTQARFAKRLQAMGVDPTAMPPVRIVYGHPDGLRRQRDGSYVITVSRRTQNKRHQLNKTKLWQHTRQALSLAYLDALAEADPATHHQLQAQLDRSHQATKRLLVQHLAGAQGAVERLGLSLQLSIWHSVPQRLIKRQSAEELGQASFSTLKDWRSEAAFVLSEAHKTGWQEMAARNRKARRKLKSAITRQRTQLDGLRGVQRLSAALSGKRRRIIREIMAKEAQFRAVDALEQRQRILRRHFPLE